jgi:hypothetical protein
LNLKRIPAEAGEQKAASDPAAGLSEFRLKVKQDEGLVFQPFTEIQVLRKSILGNIITLFQVGIDAHLDFFLNSGSTQGTIYVFWLSNIQLLRRPFFT